MIVTGPQTPPPSQILAKAEHLAWWIHAGGSIKSVAPESVFDRGALLTAKGRRAATVGEWCLGALLTLLRQLNAYDSTCTWATGTSSPTAGSSSGRRWASWPPGHGPGLHRPARALQCRVLVYDPYLSIPQANAFGSKIASLQEVMACPIVSLHAPCPPDRGDDHPELVERMPDGGVLINSADARLVDGQALMRHLALGPRQRPGRVRQRSPLPANHALRNLKNVLLTPAHRRRQRPGPPAVAAAAADGLTAMEGLPVACEVTRDTWPIID